MEQLKKIKQIKRHNGGGIIFSYDYSTLEIKIFSAISGDEKLKNVLLSGADLHCNAARKIFSNLTNKTDKEIKEHYSHLRSKAKSCLIGDTEIYLSNGNTKKISELIKDSNYKIISRDEKTGNIIESEIVDIKETKKTTVLIELELEDGKKIKCTQDHLIRLKNGKYKEAKDLTEDDDIDTI